MKTLRLNEAQRQAVEHRGTPSLVLAGAGSGKTRVLTARIAHLVETHGVPADRILAVTFTNRAAGEMKRRVASLLGREPTGLWIGTFHSVAARMLRREAERLGFTRQFTIYDDADQLALLKRLLERAGHAPKTYPPRAIRAIISHAKNRMLTPAAIAAEAVEPVERVAAEIFEAYVSGLRERNAMDFDDLLLHPLTLFREHPDRLAAYQTRFAAVLVDEFQDTNRAQYLLVRHLSVVHRELCAVGDDDQSIYGWRGAEIRNMLDFQDDFPETKVYRLEENYRSTQFILDAANGVIAANTDRWGKTLFTGRGNGEPIVVLTAADERDEAEWVAREFRERATADHQPYVEMAVLYRTNAQSRAFEEAFRRLGVPHRVVGSVSFFARREVRDLLAYLRLIANVRDDEAFVRAVQVPKRGIGPTSLGKLMEAAQTWNRSLLDTAAIADRIRGMQPRAQGALARFADLMMHLSADAETASPAQILEQTVEAIDYEAHLATEGLEGAERLENVRELIAGAAEWSEEVADGETGSPLERFLASSALTTSDESTAGDPEGVQLMTVHTAKGLEWPVVAVTGLEDGLFPLQRSVEAPGGEEEERRLAYVAITRARDRLYLCWARSRRRGGQLQPTIASRFLDAVPPDIAESRRTSGVFNSGWRAKSAAPARYAFAITGERSVPSPGVEMESQDVPRYIKGERVRHRTFGSGTILALAGAGRDLKVTVAFDDDAIATKQLLVSYAGLERDWDPA